MPTRRRNFIPPLLSILIATYYSFAVVTTKSFSSPAIESEINLLLSTARQEAAREFGGLQRNPEVVSTEHQQQLKVTLREGDIIVAEQENTESPAGLSNDVVADKTLLWPHGRIPYKIDPRFSEAQKRLIQHAIYAFEVESCIRFVKKTERDENYLYIRRVTIGCMSEIGYAAVPRQLVNFAPDCFDQFGRLLHELMHAVGFFHTQSRSDRDDWIKILWENIPRGWRFNFDKLSSEELDDLGLPYDYGSLMHYPPDAFGEPVGTTTIIPKKPLAAGVIMGQRRFFSDLDVKKINILYNCSALQSGKSSHRGGSFSKCDSRKQTECTDRNGRKVCAVRCDGMAQCHNRQDELSCPKPTCPASSNDAFYWPCNTVKCIPSSWICDGVGDCPDGEDERPENCRQRRCSSLTQLECGKCVDAYRVCDGKRDCPNGEDESEQFCARKRQQQQPPRSSPTTTSPAPVPHSFVLSNRPARQRPPGPPQFRNPIPFVRQSVQQFQLPPPHSPSINVKNSWPPHQILSPAFWQRVFRTQSFTTPLNLLISPVITGLGFFHFDALPPSLHQHCFIDTKALHDRPEIRLTSQHVDDILNTLSVCNVVELGWAEVNLNSLSVQFSDIEEQNVLRIVQKAKADLNIESFLIVVGGITFSDIATLRAIGNDVTKSEKFAQNCVEILRGWNATGLVLEWLKPTVHDRTALNALIKSIATAFQYDENILLHNKTRLVFGMTVPLELQPGHDEKLIADSVDFLNVITESDTATQKKKMFYTNNFLTTQLSNTELQNGTALRKTWLGNKSMRKRINIGIRLGPRTWTTASTAGRVLDARGAPFMGTGSLGRPGPLSGTAGKLNAGELCILLTAPNSVKDNWQTSNVSDHAVAYSALRHEWIAYETAASLKEKMKQARKYIMLHFNGIYIEDAQNDDINGLCGREKYELLKVLSAQ